MLGLGLTLASQYLDQLTPHLRSALLGTVRSHVVFQLGHDDARIFEKMFSPSLNATDLTQLAAYEIAIRASVDKKAHILTGATLPLPSQLRRSSYLIRESGKRYGVERSQIEKVIDDRTKLSLTVGGGQLHTTRGGQISLL